MAKPKQEIRIEVPDDLIKELLTDSEARMVKQRFLIIKLLENKLSIRAIAKKVGVGTDTVVRMIKKFDNSPKLKEIIRLKNPSKINSTWIFGQSSSKEEFKKDF